MAIILPCTLKFGTNNCMVISRIKAYWQYVFINETYFCARSYSLNKICVVYNVCEANIIHTDVLTVTENRHEVNICIYFQVRIER